VLLQKFSKLWLHRLHRGVCACKFHEFVCGHQICLPLIYLIGTANPNQMYGNKDSYYWFFHGPLCPKYSLQIPAVWQHVQINQLSRQQLLMFWYAWDSTTTDCASVRHI
jgi:hypothetical protein